MSQTGFAFALFTAYAFSVLAVGNLLVATTLSSFAWLGLALAVAGGIYLVKKMLEV